MNRGTLAWNPESSAVSEFERLCFASELQTPFHCVSMSAVCRHVGFRPRPSVLAPIDPPLLPPS